MLGCYWCRSIVWHKHLLDPTKAKPSHTIPNGVNNALVVLYFRLAGRSCLTRSKYLIEESCIRFFSRWISCRLILGQRAILLRRCDNRTCLFLCGLSNLTRACCGTGPAGFGNTVRWGGPGRWRAAARRRMPPSAPASGRTARDGLPPTRTACCWTGPRPSSAHPCLIVSAPALYPLVQDYQKNGLSINTPERDKWVKDWSSQQTYGTNRRKLVVFAETVSLP